MRDVSQYGVFDFLDKPNLDRLEEVVVGGVARGFSPPDETFPEREFRKLMKELKE